METTVVSRNNQENLLIFGTIITAITLSIIGRIKKNKFLKVFAGILWSIIGLGFFIIVFILTAGFRGKW